MSHSGWDRCTQCAAGRFDEVATLAPRTPERRKSVIRSTVRKGRARQSRAQLFFFAHISHAHRPSFLDRFLWRHRARHDPLRQSRATRSAELPADREERTTHRRHRDTRLAATDGGKLSSRVLRVSTARLRQARARVSRGSPSAVRRGNVLARRGFPGHRQILAGKSSSSRDRKTRLALHSLTIQLQLSTVGNQVAALTVM